MRLEVKSEEEWATLNDAERVAYCRRAAREAEAHAQSLGDAAIREINKRLAVEWRRLAEDIERGEGPPRG